ncbi:uncharacterized protein FOMMEDRAFT_17776 [Fomitiporia mediterranea MF3/22]|uniref:uncharacterized protein n=1 Tax=Fomitiporia mediterranea (strain MF3/22) TaxID=694068 RepID=UPI000440818B|nr:uncharacterized protein FOMMEDRAFT_17776 [Fomitiporia mediterranea MF3/22]EJD05483.1 hypothetical protein FOMMEDRAFT_17776 [Fomitiporia mediterranea MF3/22]
MSNADSRASEPELPTYVLDPNLYDPTREEIDFLKSQTGITDEEELKQHVLAVQKEAWAVFTYRCIQAFGFITLKISHLPAYQDLLKLGKERPGAIFLDLACCFGNDIRKAIADGYPKENSIASDLEGAFWGLGNKLYRTTEETFPVPFVQGNVFDAEHIAPAPPHYSSPTTPRPVLSSLTSLTPLQGHVSALHVAAFFHLFGKEEQITAAHRLASLLSPVPGSMIFGTHTTRTVSGERIAAVRHEKVYCFNPEDWCALWDGEAFRKGSVLTEATIVDDFPWVGKGFGSDIEKVRRATMVWSVKRI